ncbi:NADH dehydrogenase [ubiquinone] 1 alpha subcomplex assembly factor 2-like [Ptychodera flava]|uniref:NADH dehydrogenase [ubiquinone] 1 alpha subcomplex assembly factor 2-like n=1 Tax=Ptychodera flava TaxID=63121 RepID=UPI003969D13B
MNFARSLLRSFRSAKKLVGTDHLGNKYYEVPERTTAFGGHRRGRRFIESKFTHDEYKPGMVPIEWEAWIRWKRKEPPTAEEVLGRERMTQIVKERAKEIDRKEKECKEKEYQEGLVARPTQTVPKGHASAPFYERTETSADATQTGKDFQPGAWQPSSSKK